MPRNGARIVSPDGRICTALRVGQTLRDSRRHHWCSLNCARGPLTPSPSPAAGRGEKRRLGARDFLSNEKPRSFSDSDTRPPATTATTAFGLSPPSAVGGLSCSCCGCRWAGPVSGAWQTEPRDPPAKGGSDFSSRDAPPTQVHGESGGGRGAGGV